MKITLVSYTQDNINYIPCRRKSDSMVMLFNPVTNEICPMSDITRLNYCKTFKNDYEPLEYIEHSNNQYIDIGISVN